MPWESSPCLPDVIVTLQFQLKQNRCYRIILAEEEELVGGWVKKSSLRFSSNSSKLVVRDESDTELGLGLVKSGNQPMQVLFFIID